MGVFLCKKVENGYMETGILLTKARESCPVITQGNAKASET